MVIIKQICLVGLMLIIFGCQSNSNKSTSDEITSEDSTLDKEKAPLKLSLAEWSFHKAIFDKEMSHLDFIREASKLGFTGVDYVNQFFVDKATDLVYLDSMNRVAAEMNIKQLLIMVDGEGNIGDADSVARNQAVENHYKWVDAAKYLGCHSIRVNAKGKGTREELKPNVVDGLKKLCQYAAKKDIHIIVENHGGFSSDADWMSDVIRTVNMVNCGTLPDFGNFCVAREGGAEWEGKCVEQFDTYEGVNKLMPYAKSVSAKSYDFNEQGDETTLDYQKLMAIVQSQNFNGFIGVEYEGSKLSEREGIIATKALIEKTW